MRIRRINCVFALCLAFLINGMVLPAFAQFGVGFGGWNGHFGTWFGVGTGYGCCRGYGYPHRYYPRPEPAIQAQGFLEGNVRVQPICQHGQSSVCTLDSNILSNVMVSAEPYGSTQGVTARPDAQGHYRLSLPPGGYNVTVYHPILGSKPVMRFHQVTVRPGQTILQDFRIDLPGQETLPSRPTAQPENDG